MSHIRPVTDHDLAAICELYNHYVRNTVITFVEEELDLDWWRDQRDTIAALGWPFLIAESDRGELLGFAYAAPWRARAAYRRTAEHSIYLHPEATGRGVGRALLAALIRQAREAGIHQLIAMVCDQDTQASQALHRAMGFRHAGHTTAVGYKHQRELGVLILQRDARQPLAEPAHAPGAPTPGAHSTATDAVPG